MSRLHPTRRIVALSVAVVALAGLSLASASQVGLNGGTLQSGVGAVLDCQPAGQAIRVSLTSTFSGGTYTSTAVTMSNVNVACQGLAYRMQLVSTTGVVIDGNGAAAGTDASGTVNLVNNAFTQPITGTSTSTIGRVALIIIG